MIFWVCRSSEEKILPLKINDWFTVASMVLFAAGRFFKGIF